MLEEEDEPVKELAAEKILLQNFTDEQESQIYKVCFQAIEHAIEALRSQETVKVQETQYAEVTKQFGLYKMRALEFLQKISSNFSEQILLEFVDCKVFTTLFDILEEYPFNNLL